MLGNFTFHNPTKLHFGEDSLSKLSEELTHYGKRYYGKMQKASPKSKSIRSIWRNTWPLPTRWIV